MKNNKIQVLMAISIFAVVLIHTCPMGLAQVYIRPFINFGVSLFIFLSGYLTDINKINVKDFYKKRIFRVLFPYLIWTFLYTTAYSFFDGFDFMKYIYNFFTGKAAASLYYILVYIQFVLLTPALGRLLKTKYFWIGFLIAPFSLGIKYYCLLNNNNISYYLSLFYDISCLGWFSFYYLGLFIKNKIQFKYNTYALIICYVLSMALQILEGYYLHKYCGDSCGTQLKISSLLSSSIFIMISYNYIKSSHVCSQSFLTIVGDYSFGIYISHLMIISIFSKFLSFWNSVPFVLNTILVLFVSFIMCVFGRKILGDKISKSVGLF